jgi:hypothetical protein
MAEEQPINQPERIQKPRGRPKKPPVEDIQVPPEVAAQLLTVSKSKLKSLLPKKELSEKQRLHCEKFGLWSKERSAAIKAKKEEEKKAVEDAANAVTLKVVNRTRTATVKKPEEVKEEKKETKVEDVEAKVQAIKKIDEVLSQPVNRYLALLQAKSRRR